MRFPRHALQSNWNAVVRFSRDTRGSLALWFAVALVPLLLALGAGLDYGRNINLKAQLQGAADSAALAGAGAYVSSSTATTAATLAKTYMANFVSAMGSTNGITYTVTTSSKTSGSTATLYAVTVTVSATIANTVMALSKTTNTVSVNSTATNPVYTLTLTLSSYTSSAADSNTVSYYIVPTDGSAPSSTTQFFTNNGTNSSSAITVQLTASQKLGFMLTNVTGGRTGSYGSNAYGGAYRSSHLFYSHMSPPSLVAYPKVSLDCSLQVTTSSAAVTSGSCLSALPTYATVNCASASGMTLIYSWNDMGGSTDDKDFNDMVYKVKCSQNDSTLGAGVVLTD